jgi:hypothetical protein
MTEVLVEEFSDLSACFFGPRHAIIELVLGGREIFEDFELRIDPPREVSGSTAPCCSAEGRVSR